MLNRLLAILTAITAALAVVFGLRAKEKQAEAERDLQRAEVAEASNTTSQRINQAQQETEQRHRQEQIDAEARLVKGERNHLDNNW